MPVSETTPNATPTRVHLDPHMPENVIALVDAADAVIHWFNLGNSLDGNYFHHRLVDLRAALAGLTPHQAAVAGSATPEEDDLLAEAGALRDWLVDQGEHHWADVTVSLRVRIARLTAAVAAQPQRRLSAEVGRLRALLAAVTDPDGCSAEVLAEARAAVAGSATPTGDDE